MTCKPPPCLTRHARPLTCHPRPRCGQLRHERLRRPVLLPPTKIRARGAVHYSPDDGDVESVPRRNR
jgi:hypothetical protein